MKHRKSIGGPNTSIQSISSLGTSFSISRYRQSSLPPSVKAHRQQIQPISQIYFDKHKKSRFMKNIVDGYFDDKSNEFQVKRIISDIKHVVNKGKNGYFHSNHSSPPNQMPEKITQPSIIMKRRSLNANLPQKPAKKILMFSQDSPSYQEPLNISSLTNFNSFLPPIEELIEQIPIMNGYHSSGDNTLKFPELTSTIQLNIEPQQNEKVLVYENQAFRVFVLHENGKPVSRMKQFTNQGSEILKREQKVASLGIQSIWKESLISSNCLLSPLIHPIKNLICKIVPNLENNSSKSTPLNPISKFKVKSTSFRKYLLANDCLQLKHLLRQICLTLKKIQGRVLNNKVNPSNIFALKGGKILLGEWGYSSFRGEYEIQTSKFQSRVHPILKSETTWLTTPQYLSPQILTAVNVKAQEQEPDIWEYASSSDIWSLGLTIFQIISMIPLWMNDPCMIRYSNSKPTKLSTKSDPQSPVMRPRKGLLATDDRKIQKILQKQRNISSHIKRILQFEIEQHIDEDIVELIKKMVVFEPSQRITLDEILSIIK